MLAAITIAATVVAVGVATQKKPDPVNQGRLSTDMSIAKIATELGVTGKSLARDLELAIDVDKKFGDFKAGSPKAVCREKYIGVKDNPHEMSSRKSSSLWNPAASASFRTSAASSRNCSRRSSGEGHRECVRRNKTVARCADYERCGLQC